MVGYGASVWDLLPRHGRTGLSPRNYGIWCPGRGSDLPPQTYGTWCPPGISGITAGIWWNKKIHGTWPRAEGYLLPQNYETWGRGGVRPTPSKSRNGGTVTYHPWQRNETLACSDIVIDMCGNHDPAAGAAALVSVSACQRVRTLVGTTTSNVPG
jgi:hypothetical protein